MAKYKKLYFKAFNAITEIIEILKKLQQELEDDYLELSKPTTQKNKKKPTSFFSRNKTSVVHALNIDNAYIFILPFFLLLLLLLL